MALLANLTSILRAWGMHLHLASVSCIPWFTTAGLIPIEKNKTKIQNTKILEYAGDGCFGQDE
jgi:hypothetical protein